jgi:cholesterol transport system auxiliary component
MSTKPALLLHRRALLAAGGAGILLAGCSNIVGPPASPQLYMLKPILPDLKNGPKVRWSLNIGAPDADDAMDSDRITISRSANTLDSYAGAAWTDHLPALVQSVIDDAFEASGRIDQVAEDDRGLRADYLLQTDIREFVARYDTPDGPPVASVKIEARLVVSTSKNTVARMVFSAQRAAAQNNVDAAVVAFDGALGEVLGGMVNWALAADVETNEPVRPAPATSRRRRR